MNAFCWWKTMQGIPEQQRPTKSDEKKIQLSLRDETVRCTGFEHVGNDIGL